MDSQLEYILKQEIEDLKDKVGELRDLIGAQKKVISCLTKKSKGEVEELTLAKPMLRVEEVKSERRKLWWEEWEHSKPSPISWEGHKPSSAAIK